MKEAIKIFSETGCIPHDVLWKYRQGTLSAKEKHRVELHLTDCELCSDALEGITLMNSDKIFAELREEVKHVGEFEKVFRLYDYRWLAAASVALLFVFYYVIQYNVESDKKEISQLNISDQKKMETENNTAITSALQEKVIAQKEEQAPAKKTKTDSPPVLEKDNAQPDLQSGVTALAANDESPNTFSREVNEMVVPEVSKAETKSGGYAVTAEPAAAPAKEEENITLVQKKVEFASARATESAKDKSTVKARDSRQPAAAASENTVAENKNKAEENLPAKEVAFNYSETLGKGLAFYRDKKTAEAIASFNEILTHNPDDLSATFYKGLCYFDAGNYFPARELFGKTILNADKKFYEEAKFKLALCCASLNQTDEAKKILKEVVDEKGSFSEGARGELEKLK